MTIQFGLPEFSKRDQVGGRNRLLDVSEKVRLCGCINRFKQGDRQPLKSELMLTDGVAGPDILVDERGPGAADEIGRPFDGALPKRRVDSGIVDDADQIAQSLLIVEACVPTQQPGPVSDVTLYSFQKVPRAHRSQKSVGS